MSPWRLRKLAKEIAHGAVIAYPTDTIWGLGCHPMQYQAVLNILRIKQRPMSKGLILLSSDVTYCEPYIKASELTALSSKTIAPYSRPITWLIDKASNCPQWLAGNSPLIAVRITDNPLIKSLCRHLSSPLVSTSANISGRTVVRNAILAHRHFQSQVDSIIEGFATSGYQASEIRNLKNAEVIRS